MSFCVFLHKDQAEKGRGQDGVGGRLTLKGRVEITFSDSDMKITYLKNDRFYKRKDTHIEINEIKEIDLYNYKGVDIAFLPET